MKKMTLITALVLLFSLFTLTAAIAGPSGTPSTNALKNSGKPSHS